MNTRPEKKHLERSEKGKENPQGGQGATFIRGVLPCLDVWKNLYLKVFSIIQFMSEKNMNLCLRAFQGKPSLS